MLTVGCLIASCNLFASSFADPELQIDASGTGGPVIDGDTFEVAFVGRVRLADIDAPELGSIGFREATKLLRSLVDRRWVYLDLDEIHLTDKYGRLVAVAFVRHNTTHLLNVNKALLEANLVEIEDFPNEFNPVDWGLYVEYPLEMNLSEFGEALRLITLITVVLLITLVSLITFLFHRRRARRETSRPSKSRTCTLHVSRNDIEDLERGGL